MLQHVTHCAKDFGAAIVSLRARPRACQNARVGEIFRMHELIEVIAAVQNGHISTLVYPFEKYLKDPEPPVPHDRPRPDDRDVQSPIGIFLA